MKYVIFISYLLSSISFAQDNLLKNKVTFDGVIIPKSAVELRVLQNYFSVQGWNSTSSGNKIVEMVEDAALVKKGDVLIEFDFSHTRALKFIKRSLNRQISFSQKHAAQDEERLIKLKHELNLRINESKLAKINTKKKAAISRRQFKLYEIEYKMAKFQVKAQKDKVAVFDELKRLNKKYQEKELKRWRENIKRYHIFEDRFKLRAPCDGIVRYAYNRGEKRKVSKGDYLQAGTHVLSLAKDESVALKFYVPENKLKHFKLNDKIYVNLLSEAEKYSAIVKKIEYFPQEIGFLKHNNKLPNAYEKAFVLHADFEKQPKNLSSGAEVEVQKQ